MTTVEYSMRIFEVTARILMILEAQMTRNSSHTVMTKERAVSVERSPCCLQSKSLARIRNRNQSPSRRKTDFLLIERIKFKFENDVSFLNFASTHYGSSSQHLYTNSLCTMKLAVLSTLLASAAAFAPASQKSGATTALAAKSPFSSEVGAMAPVRSLSL